MGWEISKSKFYLIDLRQEILNAQKKDGRARVANEQRVLQEAILTCLCPRFIRVTSQKGVRGVESVTEPWPE